jgi:uroporphyrinogen decarboxylase
MTEKQRFIATLKREPVAGRVPTFELVFFLTMESIGKVHPSHRSYHQWGQMSAAEQRLQLHDMAECHIQIAEKYRHSAIFVHPNPGDLENTVRLLEIIREKTGDNYFLMIDRDPTFSIPEGKNMMAFTERLYEQPEQLKREAERRMAECVAFAQGLKKRGGLLDGFAMCADYCFNVNPFFSREMFTEFISPYLSQTIKAYHDMGYLAIKHTDGNIMPIIDLILECGPDALHSLDPQGGVDLAQVSRDYGDRAALIGNVHCGLLQTGTQEECEADVRRALRQGMARGSGYIFSTSNCAYTGLPLERYELMNRIWYEEGIY